MWSCQIAVTCVTELVAAAALVSIHGMLTFLADVYGLFDPSGKSLWLAVNQ